MFFLTEDYCKTFIDETNRIYGRYMANAIEHDKRIEEETRAVERLLRAYQPGNCGMLMDAIFYQWSDGRITSETMTKAYDRLTNE